MYEEKEKKIFKKEKRRTENIMNRVL